MKRSFFIYNNGELKRKDNTLTFIDENLEKRDIPIENINDLNIMSELSFNTKMINYISNHQSNKILCLIELPLLTQEIDDYLKKMKNCINVVMIYKTNNPLLYRNIYLFDDQLIDLNDEQQIYNLYLNKGICTLQEAQQMIINNINNKLDISITNQ